MAGASGILRQPEPNVLLFGFLLNLPWELLQIPFYAGMQSLPHGEGVLLCAGAAAGDAAILLAAFWCTAMLVRSRSWIAHPSWLALACFIGAGQLATVIIEQWATQAWDRWSYAESMPTVPVIGTGLLPVLQWLLLPLLVVWLARRQMRGQD